MERDDSMTCLKYMGILAFSALICLQGTASAEDAIVIDTDQAKRDAAKAGRAAAEVGESAKREGLRIADEASDFAKDVADSFSDAYEDAKHR